MTESFYAGGRYIHDGGATYLVDQIHVRRLSPDAASRPYPIVMIHGGGLTGSCWETTPDGRPGWAGYFVDQGFTVYVIDQPGRGRSTFHPSVHGSRALPHSAERIERRQTAIEAFNLWPQAKRHTQWPGTGKVGDPVFDQYYASQVSDISNAAMRERLLRAAGAALLDRIGPSIIMTHSQSGALGWQIGDACPTLTRAILAIEPTGPPFVNLEFVGAPDYFNEGALVRPFGITATAVEYDPPVNEAPEVKRVRKDAQVTEDGDPVPHGYLQSEPARKLSNLSRIPVLVVTSEASYHAAYDHHTVEYLRQAGVDVTHLVLAEKQIFGNGHMMMLESNSDVIACAIEQWLQARNY